jgi:hypothetical protein
LEETAGQARQATSMACGTGGRAGEGEARRQQGRNGGETRLAWRRRREEEWLPCGASRAARDPPVGTS